MRHTRILVTHYGGPDALQLVEEECPEPKNGEVRVRVLAAGVCLPDVMAREGTHPETPRLPFTPGWDLVGVVDRLGDGISGIEPGLPQRELVPVPSGLDAAEVVSLVLNYITAYQMLHRAAKVRSGQRVLIHGAAGGVGTALLRLGCLAGLEMYGTCAARGTPSLTPSVAPTSGIPARLDGGVSSRSSGGRRRRRGIRCWSFRGGRAGSARSSIRRRRSGCTSRGRTAAVPRETP